MTRVDESGAIHFCEHDWRRDPYAPATRGIPPKRRAVCAKCLAEGVETVRQPDGDDVTTWPRVTGDVQ